MHDTDVHGTSISGVTAGGLGKRFDDLWALRDVDLDVPAGTVLGLLGHNGAGKTTAIRILTTLALPTTGTATVDGIDVVAEPAKVRTRIGLAGQATTVDDLLTARANLEMIGRLYHLPRREARRRGDELLERLGLTEAADRLVGTYSGGMRRRLDLAAGLVAAPPVLFMDEPTTGLDPQARNELWAVLRELVSDGASLVLTTQYLEEADRLADSIVVLDQGRVVAEGTPAELKQQVGGERVEVTIARPADVARAAAALVPFGDAPPVADENGKLVTVPVRADARLIEIVRALDGAGVDATDIHRREATLDDAFLALTDRPAERAA